MGRFFTRIRRSQGLALVAVALLAIPVALAFSFVLQPLLERLAPHSSWTQFKPNLVAVGIGIPAGLWIARVGEYWRVGREKRERTSRRRVVLQQLREELEFNRTQCQQTRDEANAQPQRFVPRLELRTQAWEGLSASGDLQLIEDPKLLTQIAVAYYMSNEVNAWLRPLPENYASLNYATAGLGLDAAARFQPRLVETTNEAQTSLEGAQPCVQGRICGRECALRRIRHRRDTGMQGPQGMLG